MPAMNPKLGVPLPSPLPALPLASRPLAPGAERGRGIAYMPKAQRTDWRTPPALFDKLAAEFGPFDLDPCGAADSYASRHCAGYWADGGLDHPWWGRVFVNPPYGRELKWWVARCASSILRGETSLVVALLPSRTDTIWWHGLIGDHCQYPAEVRFLKGRLKFVGATASAPFPSVIVVWRRGNDA